MWNIYIHSNVRLPIGPLRILIGAPELHHWHHDRDRFNGNYSNVFPVLDLIFGTYKCPPHEPRAYGIGSREEQQELPESAPASNAYPVSYLGQLWQPFQELLRRRH
ncbi:MAG: sterol desaturase family protein [Candidatus Methylacidiphilales bacterium]